MIYRVFGVAAVLAASVLIASTFSTSSDAARRIDRDGVLIAGHDGVDQQIANINSSGQILTNAQGPAADDAAASGNPVPVGCKYNSTPNTVEDGDISYLNCGTRGSLNVTIVSPDSVTPLALGAVADNITSGANGLYTVGRNVVYDGANWDMQLALANATNSTGAGITAAGILAQYDDTSPTSITENQFGNIRMTADRGIYTSLKANGGTLEGAFTCDQSAVVAVAAAATTELVALSASQVIRVCAFTITGDTAITTATFVYGTGSNCATGQAALTGAMRMVDEGNLSNSAAQGSLFRTASANALCLTAATGAVSGFISYAKY